MLVPPQVLSASSMAFDLLALQNKIKRDHSAYKEEFLQQYNHFESLLQVFQLDGSKGADSQQLRSFTQQVSFLSHVDISLLPIVSFHVNIFY